MRECPKLSTRPALVAEGVRVLTIMLASEYYPREPFLFPFPNSYIWGDAQTPKSATCAIV